MMIVLTAVVGLAGANLRLDCCCLLLLPTRIKPTSQPDRDSAIGRWMMR